ncbi:MAG: apbE 2 [Armatimonadetes bacterium]|jgi:hypothetical protein|nr:apbE 2 [Armatimonadota bacterium]
MGPREGAPGSETIGAGALRRIASRRRLLLRAAGVLALLAPVRRSLAQAKGKAKPAAARDVPWDDRWELLVQLDIAEPESTGRYHRPYVAVWVEDTDGVPVRTLGLWVQNSGRGPRWIPDLRRWFRGERVRQLADGGDLVASVSSATRMPGAYKLVWNGRDDQNKPVRQGRYTLCIEAAREHGTYQILRKDITAGRQPFRAELGANVEIKSASLDYRLRK